MVLIRTRKVIAVLISIALFLAFISVLVKVVNLSVDQEYPLDETITRLANAEEEAGIPTWFSSSLLLICSILLAIIAIAKKGEGGSYLRHWQVLALIFLSLSLDESISIHEIPIPHLRSALHASGLFYFTWVIPGTAALLIFGLAYLRFLAHLPTEIRRLFLVAGVLYVGGALGMEAIGGYYADVYSTDYLLYSVLVAVEESLEMLGASVFIYTLLSYIDRHTNVEIRI